MLKHGRNKNKLLKALNKKHYFRSLLGPFCQVLRSLKFLIFVII